MSTLVAQPVTSSAQRTARQVGHWRASNPVYGMMVCAFVLRFLIVLSTFHSVALPSADNADFGWEMGWVARSIASSHGFSSPFFPATGATALVPPLYPYLLALVFRVFGIYSASSALVILTINSVCSSLTCLPIFKLASQIGGRKTALIAGWLWVLYPFSVYFASTRVWEYSLTALLFSTCWWLAHDFHPHSNSAKSLGLGALYGVAILCNPSVLSLYPVVTGIAIWRTHPSGYGRLRSAVLILFGTLLVALPWAVRNHRVLKADVPVRDGFWLECWAGNHGDLSNSNPEAAHPASNKAEMRRYQNLGEVAYLAEKRTQTIAYVESHPIETLAVTIRRVFRFWTGFWSFRPAYMRYQPLDVPNVFFCSTITALMLCGYSKLWRRSWRLALPSLLLLLIFPLPYYLSHSSMDYRQPVEPIVVVLVAVGCCRNETSRTDPVF